MRDSDSGAASPAQCEADAPRDRGATRDAWVGTQLQALAVAGLAAAHAEPFVRVLFHLPARSKSPSGRGSRSSRVVSLDNASAACRRWREPNGMYTAVWDERGSPTVAGAHSAAFALPPALRHVELQVWNRFPNGVDAFLGAATVAVKRLRRRLLSEQQSDDDRGDPSAVQASAGILRAPLLWYPLLPPPSDSHHAAAGGARLSVQLDVRFLSDPRASATREKVAREIAAERLRRGASSSSSAARDSQQPRVADPAFAFVPPSQAIDWSAVVSTSLRHIFFHADVDRLSSFKHQVLYGDLLRELQDDDGLHVHDAHLAAFRLAQLSAQYLDHCADTLAARSDDYSEQLRVLAATRRQLRQSRSQLKRQRDRLKTESGELDLLLATYRSIADETGAAARGDDGETSSPLASPRRSGAHSPVGHTGPHASESPPSSPVVAQKPAFLLTWEERERERKLAKDRSKAQRIAEEKTRLEQLAERRRAQELQQQRFSSLLERGRQRAASTIQCFVRRARANCRRQQTAKEREAAVRIQTRVRGRARRRAYPVLLERHRAALELSRMAASEREMRALLLHEHQQQQQIATEVESLALDASAGSPVAQDVSLLVATWRRLRRVFVLARTPSMAAGEDAKAYEGLFAKLDARRDGVLDRAELRLGVRSFGIRMDRKLTRMLIALVRAKCSAPPQPLLISFAHFVRGFDLLRCSKERLGAALDDDWDGGEAQPADTTRDRVRAEADAKYDDDDDDDDGDDDASDASAAVGDPIAIVSQAVATLRRTLVDAATLHLEALGMSTTSFRAFRDALAFVFQEFDADGNGELDVAELVSCVRSIGVELSQENLALLRDCFGCDGDDDRIGIADFISFALARAGEGGAENLGLVGARLREAVLRRIRVARQQTESIEDAVRLVFRRAYPSESRRACSIAVFAKTLSALQLGVKPAQLARLVMRLDRDSDRSISFDELLLWLRLCTASELAETEAVVVDLGKRRYARVEEASDAASRVRSLLRQLAGVDSSAVGTTSPASVWRPALLQVFRAIDRDDSKKITRDEIERFFASKDLAGLSTGVGGDSELSPSRLANSVSDAIDVDRNGVVTLDEWMEFLGPSSQVLGDGSSRQQEQPPDLFAMLNGVRAALQAAVGDEVALVTWFHGLPGALPMPSTATPAAVNGVHQPQMKVRVGVVKAALRTKVGASSLPPLAVDEAVKRLDSDHSGWITTAELQRWTFPPRDLEALVRVVADCWRHEEERAGPDFALALYSRFDADGNGVLAQREIRGGFASFGLRFKIEEVAVLTRAFDSDLDGCWSKTEFLAFVYKLFPQAIFRTTSASSAAAGEHADDGYDDDSADGARESLETANLGGASAKALGERADEYADDGFMSSLSSSPSSSPRAESGELQARESLSASNRTSAAEPNVTEYSEDFD